MNYIERYLNWGQGDYKNGKVIIDKSACTGCKQCVNVCPASALEMINKKSEMKSKSDCISCSACQAVCAEDAIHLSSFWNIPSGSFQTINRKQSCGSEAFPRIFE